MDTKRRTIAKALTWRVVATLTTMTVSFVLTGSFHIALSIGIVDTIIKLGAYYIHERAWSKTTWGVNGNKYKS